MLKIQSLAGGFAANIRLWRDHNNDLVIHLLKPRQQPDQALAFTRGFQVAVKIIVPLSPE